MTGEEDCESGVSRREALQTGTFATAGLLGLSSLGSESARAQSSEPRIRLGDEWVIDPDGDDFSIEHSSLGVSFVWDESVGYWVPGGGGFDMDGGDIVDDGTTVWDSSESQVGDGSTSADHQSVDTGQASIDEVPYPNKQRTRGHRQVAVAPVETDWVKEPTNPVMANDQPYESGGISEAAVTFAESRFVMLYGASDGTDIHINLATSPDGIDWTKDPNNPVVMQTGAGNPVGQMSIGYVDGEYVMFARDTTTNEIRYFTSPDAVNWTDHGVVLSPSASGWDSNALYNTCFLKMGQTWYVWYEATGGGSFKIGLAVGNDPTNLTKFADPVLDVSASGFDSNAVYNPSVYYDEGMFYMWYGANDGTNHPTGLATSTDGVHWTKHGLALPVGSAGEWDDTQAMDPSVLRVGERFYMWYKGADDAPSDNQQVGLAVNDLGVTLP